MKIGLMGGSFDPVHFGHLMAAQDAMEQFQLDRMVFVPAAQAPLKLKGVQASAQDRLAMLRAAIADDPRMEISEYELRQGGINYTIDTVRHFRALMPLDELHWVIGGDQLALLPKWKAIEELAKLIGFIFLARPGYPIEPAAGMAIPGLRLQLGKGHLLEISSTELRDRAKKGLALHYHCPEKVIAYIEENRLYR